MTADGMVMAMNQKTSVSVYWRLAVSTIFILLATTNSTFAGKPRPVGTVTISAKQISFVVSGQRGGGVLNFKGKNYRFRIGGLGFGGIGIAKLSARGEVYDLKKASDFFGAYGAARIGWAVGDVSSGQMWLKNQHGVVLHLWTDRKGLMLSMGADVIDISPR